MPAKVETTFARPGAESPEILSKSKLAWGGLAAAEEPAGNFGRLPVGTTGFPEGRSRSPRTAE
jgi:hypothetical protein